MGCTPAAAPAPPVVLHSTPAALHTMACTLLPGPLIPLCPLRNMVSHSIRCRMPSYQAFPECSLTAAQLTLAYDADVHVSPKGGCPQRRCTHQQAACAHKGVIHEVTSPHLQPARQ